MNTELKNAVWNSESCSGKTLKKAVFPVAGMGTRFLPATKANPKEMLPIVDKPLIQYAVEEAIEAGFTEMIFVTSSSKRAIEDHFDANYELESRLEKIKKYELLNIIKNILPRHINCLYVRQPEPLGLGDAVLRAKSIVGNEPFAVLLADDLILSNGKNCLSQMVDIFNMKHTSVIGVEKVLTEDVSKYGIIKSESITKKLSAINAIIEKPLPHLAPSNLAVAGRYILTPEIFPLLNSVQEDIGGEIQLTDAIAALLKQQPIYAYEFAGKRFDCGSKLGYLKATIACALKHPELKENFTEYLQQFTTAKVYED